MKEEIKKVLNMSKAGTISEEQAAQLIDELLKKQKTEGQQKAQTEEPAMETAQPESESIGYPHEDRFEDANWAWGKLGHRHCHRGFHHRERSERGGRGGDRGGHGRDFRSYIHRAIHEAMDDKFKGGNKNTGTNRVVMSCYEKPTGNLENFDSNAIHMSSFSDVHLGESEFSHNQVDASRLHDIRLSYSKYLKNQISASSIKDFNLENGNFSTNLLRGVKFHDVQVSSGSSVERVEFNGCAVKDVEAGDKSRVTTSSFYGVVLDDVHFNQAQIQESQFFQCEITDVAISESEWVKVRAKVFAIDDCRFTKTKLQDVTLKTTDGWSFRKRGFFDTEFSHCEFERVLFSNCRFADVKIKNVNLKDLKITDVQISNMEIDGNEAFLKAIGQGKKETVS